MDQDNKNDFQIIPCRFYEKQFPDVNDLVMVEILNVEENATYVKLLEYKDQEGMITPNELTKIMQQNVHRALKVGKQDVTRVLRVDQEKGYIDLSKKQVNQQEEGQCREKYAKSNQVNSMIISVCQQLKYPDMENLYIKLVWPLYKKNQHPLDAFKNSLEDPTILQNIKCGLKNEKDEPIDDKLVLTYLNNEIKRRLTPQMLKILCEVEVACYSYEGIEDIKAALLAGEAKSKPNCAVKFHITGSPVYQGIVNNQNKQEGLEVMKEALNAIKESILKSGGTFKVKTEPKVQGNVEQENVELIQNQNEDSSDSEDSEVEGMGSAESDDENPPPVQTQETKEEKK